MAKAKKPASTGQASGARKRAGKSRKPPAAAPAPQAPLIDTDLAAANAARMLLARAKLHIDEKKAVEAMGKETPSFKTLKESLEKPASQVTAAIGNAFGPSKSNLPMHSTNQVVHDQTVGGVGRVNVPRRTAG